jgi:hypothetical protein
MTDIPDIFQSLTRIEQGGLTSRHIARSAYSASLAGFIVSSWVLSSLRWLFSHVDVVASLGTLMLRMQDGGATAIRLRNAVAANVEGKEHLAMMQYKSLQVRKGLFRVCVFFISPFLKISILSISIFPFLVRLSPTPPGRVGTGPNAGFPSRVAKFGTPRSWAWTRCLGACEGECQGVCARVMLP